MAASYTKINYSLRPAKSIERRMIVEALHLLRFIEPSLRRYRYIGFGSTFFTDFKLIHRSLGLTNLVSIERYEADSDRIRFNRPFRCIGLEFGRASEVLPRLTWRTKSIIWLDYDSKLDTEVLDDIATVCQNAVGGSVLIVTVNAEPVRAYESRKPRDDFRNRVGPDHVPVGIGDKDLKGWGLASQSEAVMSGVIESALSERSRALPVESRLGYEQLFHFEYADNAKMVTIGGLLHDARQRSRMAEVNFGSLPQVTLSGQAPYRIDVPSLTIKEMQHLDRQLPTTDPAGLRARSVPLDDLGNYARLYRHFPTYVDADF